MKLILALFWKICLPTFAHVVDADFVDGKRMDEEWLRYLVSGPPFAEDLAEKLSSRALRLATDLPENATLQGDVDVVCSAGGNLDAYYLGASMVFSRAKGIQVWRHGGASAGGQSSFEIALKGDTNTLRTHLAYGLLCEKYAYIFGNHTFQDAQIQYHHWALMASWQTKTFGHAFSSLDGRVALALSCGNTTKHLVRVSSFTATDDQATRAFIATGSPSEMYDGMACGDGWATSGPEQTPLFQDRLRPQIIVTLHKTGNPNFMMYAPLNSTWYAKLVKKGQDEAATFLSKGKIHSGAITFCPKYAKVDQNICELQNPISGVLQLI